jgi:DNA-binding transcriptional LysR family regulator
LVHEIERIRGGEIGRISLGFSSVPADILLKPVLLDIAKHRPRLQVNVELANNEDLLEHLLAERIEFFVAGTSMIDPGKRTVVRELARDHVAFFVRKRHALASRPKATIADLEEFPVLCTPIVTEGQNRTRRWLGLSKADPLPPTMVCDDLAALKYLALNSDAVLISPRSALATECAAGKLIELRLSEQRYPGSTGMWLVTLANRTPSPAAAMIIQHVETLLHDLMLNNGARRRATPVRHSAPQRTLQAHAKNLVDR